MWIIVDKRLPVAAKNKLKTFGNLIEFESAGIVYEAISGHPDIFMCHAGNELILAPNIPEIYPNIFFRNNIPFALGSKPLGNKYPHTAHYNAVVSSKFLIHNIKHTDDAILQKCKNKTAINTPQAYTRCNLLALDDTSFITSDSFTNKLLQSLKLNACFISPENIVLPGFPNGFFGGCCGIYQKKLFVSGSLTYLNAKNDVIGFVEKCGYDIIELYNGPLFDAGGLFFINSQKPFVNI
ncbi:MAG TPA: hypothetical protein PLT47_03685 [Bacteroidales bacterium]|nr:hypothetical protein [Bacteroidales bacterium]